MKRILAFLCSVVIPLSSVSAVVSCDSSVDISSYKLTKDGSPYEINVGFYPDLDSIYPSVQQQFSQNNYKHFGYVKYDLFTTKFYTDKGAKNLMDDYQIASLHIGDLFFAKISPSMSISYLEGTTNPLPLKAVNEDRQDLQYMNFTETMSFPKGSSDFIGNLSLLLGNLNNSFYDDNKIVFDKNINGIKKNNFSYHIQTLLFKDLAMKQAINFDKSGSDYLQSLPENSSFYVSFKSQPKDLYVSGQTMAIQLSIK